MSVRDAAAAQPHPYCDWLSCRLSKWLFPFAAACLLLLSIRVTYVTERDREEAPHGRRRHMRILHCTYLLWWQQFCCMRRKEVLAAGAVPQVWVALARAAVVLQALGMQLC